MSLPLNSESSSQQPSLFENSTFKVIAKKLLNSNQELFALGLINELKFDEVIFSAEVDSKEQQAVNQDLKEWKALWRLLPQSLSLASPNNSPIYFQGVIEVAGQARYVLSQSLSSTQFIFLLGLPSLMPEQAKFYLKQSIQSSAHQLLTPSHSPNVE